MGNVQAHDAWVTPLEPAPDVCELMNALALGELSAAEAAVDLYRLAGQGTCNGDAIRRAGGIPALLAVVQGEDPRAAAAEYALGALAHLGVQRTANQETLCEVGGLPVLVDLLHRLPPETQCAQYANSILTIMAMAAPKHLQQAVTEAVAVLPMSALGNYRELVLFTGRGGSYEAAVDGKQEVHLPILNLAPFRLCAICIDEIDCGQMDYALRCGHHYHYGCINNWLRQNPTCPVCREPAAHVR